MHCFDDSCIWKTRGFDILPIFSYGKQDGNSHFKASKVALHRELTRKIVDSICKRQPPEILFWSFHIYETTTKPLIPLIKF